jgi:monothiol glutaredoxin
MSNTPAFKSRIDTLVGDNKVVLFMKGNRRMPQCGFSAKVVGMLDGVIDSYETVDVLSDPEVRSGMKSYSDWPTFPQLYIGGEFVGGCDIITDMYGSGELHKTLGVELAEVAAPTITVTDSAVEQFKEALAGSPGASLRFQVTPKFQHGLDLGPKGGIDVVVACNGIELVLDRSSASRADGIVIDFVTGPEGNGFKIDNPNAPSRVRQASPEEVKALLAGGGAVLIDVRTPQEHQVAHIEGARLMDPQLEAWILAQPKDKLLMFHCHHGGRSNKAAEHFVNQGFNNVVNLAGGIDAWSQTIDTSVPRY